MLHLSIEVGSKKYKSNMCKHATVSDVINCQWVLLHEKR